MKQKRLLIVDDSEIDRSVLRNILKNDFDIVEADNGYAGLEVILNGKPKIDGVLLDIFMPVLDGFNILRLMKEHKIENLPVILVTANATKPNVEKAIFYKVSAIISKPFDAKAIAERFRTMFSIEESTDVVIPKHTFSENDIAETNTYISKLKKIYTEYLRNRDMDDTRYANTSALTKIILEEHASQDKSFDGDSAHIDMVAKAAYFLDIGHMAVPDSIISSKGGLSDSEKSVYRSHTVMGAELIWLNHSPSCRYFVKMCGDICMHHHERSDGKGFPHELNSTDNSVCVQAVSAAYKLDSILSKSAEMNDYRFDFAMREMAADPGEFSSYMLSLISNCSFPIQTYYKKLMKKK